MTGKLLHEVGMWHKKTFIYRKTYYIMIVSSNFFGGSMKSHYAAALL